MPNANSSGKLPMIKRDDPRAIDSSAQDKLGPLLEEMNGESRETFLSNEDHRFFSILQYYDRCRKAVSLAIDTIGKRMENIKDRVVHLATVLEIYKNREIVHTYSIPQAPKRKPEFMIAAISATILGTAMWYTWWRSSYPVPTAGIVLAALVPLWYLAFKWWPQPSGTGARTEIIDRSKLFRDMWDKTRESLRERRINARVCEEALRLVNESRGRIIRFHADIESLLSTPQVSLPSDFNSYFVRDLMRHHQDYERVLKEMVPDIEDFVKEFLLEYDVLAIGSNMSGAIIDKLGSFCRRPFLKPEPIGAVLLRQAIEDETRRAESKDSGDRNALLRTLLNDSVPLWPVSPDSERKTLVAMNTDADNGKLIDAFREINDEVALVEIDGKDFVFVIQIAYGKALKHLPFVPSEGKS